MKAKTQVRAQFKNGDYLINVEGEILQVTNVTPAQYSVKIWRPEIQEWSQVSRRAMRKTESSYKKITKQEVAKRIDSGFLEFVRTIRKLDISVAPNIRWSGGWLSRVRELLIGAQWIKGGTDVDPDSEPELEDLDTILEHFKPDITFLQYKKLCRRLIEYGESRDDCYYGREYTAYAYKFIRLRKLYDYMKEKEWIN